MNKELKNRIFNIPQDVMDIINHTIITLNGESSSGMMRAKKLLQDRKVKYSQLKRIIHDLQNTDKYKDRTKYNLYGGDRMLNWGKQFLKGERDLIKNKKELTKKTNEISNMDGVRKNPYLKKHKKNFDFKLPTNLIKSNSYKNSIGSLSDMKLFEEIKKIKNLINY